MGKAFLGDNPHCPDRTVEVKQRFVHSHVLKATKQPDNRDGFVLCLLSARLTATDASWSLSHGPDSQSWPSLRTKSESPPAESVYELAICLICTAIR